MATSERVNENVGRRFENGNEVLFCTHCNQELQGNSATYLSNLARYEGPLSEAGPQVFADSSVFVDAPVVFRQYYCPGCFTVFHTEVVPS